MAIIDPEPSHTSEIVAQCLAKPTDVRPEIFVK
jgi:hypothetical protein